MADVVADRKDGARPLPARFAALQRGAGVAELLPALDRRAEGEEADGALRGYREGPASAARNLLVIFVEVLLHLERDEDRLAGRLRWRTGGGALIGGASGQESGQGRYGERDSGHVVSKRFRRQPNGGP